VIALAGGPGAPYTYVETAELLTAAGADVAVVDPLRDETLPAGTRALVVGAGLPEGYAEELSANRRLCNTVAKFAVGGWPVVAEGVALPWLGHEFDGRPMCAVLDASAYTGEQTVAGYREAIAPTSSVLAPAGARITGYKQHRAVVTPRAGAVPAWTWSGGNPEGFVWRQVHASQLGLHWAAAPEIAKRLVAAAIAGPVALPQPPMGGQSGAPGPSSMPAGMPPGGMSSPSGTVPPAVPVAVASAPDMSSQVSGPDFGPPFQSLGERVAAEFGPGNHGLPDRAGADYGPSSQAMPERAASDYGTPSQGMPERPGVDFGRSGPAVPQRGGADFGPPSHAGRPERRPAELDPGEVGPDNPDRDGAGSDEANLGDTVDITAP
jgi:cobyrinic acid a,c-diamide synthase